MTAAEQSDRDEAVKRTLKRYLGVRFERGATNGDKAAIEREFVTAVKAAHPLRPWTYEVTVPAEKVDEFRRSLAGMNLVNDVSLRVVREGD